MLCAVSQTLPPVVVNMPVECPNESGECATDDCENNESPVWYGKKGNKYCKHCYDTIRGPKKQKLSSAQKEVQAAMAGDTLVKIINKVLGKR